MIILEELRAAFNIDLDKNLLLEYYSKLPPEFIEIAPIPDYIFTLIDEIGEDRFKELFLDWTLNYPAGPRREIVKYLGIDFDSRSDLLNILNNFINKYGLKAFLEIVAKAAKWDDDLYWAMFMKHKGFMSKEDFDAIWDRCHPPLTPEEKSRQRIDNGIGRMFAETYNDPENYYEEVIESIDKYLSDESFTEAVNNINKALKVWEGPKGKFDTEKLLQNMTPKEAFHKIADIIENNKDFHNGIFILLQAVPDKDIRKVKKYLKQLIE